MTGNEVLADMVTVISHQGVVHEMIDGFCVSCGKVHHPSV